eukprot:m.100614 g.100614  ORF g.100614 m.100614 type:complete len:317 (-) comp12493_c0_seq4:5769-6719(-)
MRDDGEYKREGPHTEHIGCIASVAIGTAGCLWLASTVKGDLGLNWVDAAFDRILGLSNRLEITAVLPLLAKTTAAVAACSGVLDVVRYPSRLKEIYIPGSFVGFTMGTGGLVALGSQRHWSWGCYMMSVSMYHASEYFITALHNRDVLSVDSWMINHSKEYGAAAAASWIEYWVECALFPRFQFSMVSKIGAVMVVLGDGLRKLAMHTAGTNFKHQVADTRIDGHELVTVGVYRLFRHPSYVGWFYWSIGTQLLLCNPICLLAYPVISWQFFRDRIDREELRLITFFGKDYVDYQRRVGTGLPFISGYDVVEYPSS